MGGKVYLIWCKFRNDGQIFINEMEVREDLSNGYTENFYCRHEVKIKIICTETYKKEKTYKESFFTIKIRIINIEIKFDSKFDRATYQGIKEK